MKLLDKGWWPKGYDVQGIKDDRSNKKSAHVRLCKVWTMKNKGSQAIIMSEKDRERDMVKCAQLIKRVHRDKCARFGQ